MLEEAAIHVGLVALLQDELRQERLVIDVVEAEVVLLTVEAKDSEVPIPAYELDAGDVVGLAVAEVQLLLGAVSYIIYMYRDLRVGRPCLGILIGIEARVLTPLIHGHAVLLYLALVGTYVGQVVIVLTPGEELRYLELLLIDPVRDAVHHLVARSVAGDGDLGVVLELLDEDIPLAYEGDHTPVGAEGRDHHLASVLTQRLYPIAAHIVVVGLCRPRAAIDRLLVTQQEDVMSLGLEDIVVEGLEVTFPSLIYTEERIHQLPRSEAVAQDSLVRLIHHRVVEAVAHGAHPSSRGARGEGSRIDLLNGHRTPWLLCGQRCRQR